MLDPSFRLPIYFVNGWQPFTALHAAVIAAGYDWAQVCAVIDVPEENSDVFLDWLIDYFRERAIVAEYR